MRHVSIHDHVVRCRNLIHRVLSIGLVVGAAAGCSHLNPYENAADVKASPRDIQRLLPELPAAEPADPAPVFVGSLPQALDDVDVLRRALIQTSSNMSSERSFYDAALWTIAPYLLYRAVTADAGSQDAKNTLVGGASILGAGYGFLNSRPKEYEQIYVVATDRLACLMVSYSKYLYTKDEMDPYPGWPPNLQMDLLTKAVSDYRDAAYAVSRAVVQTAGKSSSAKCAVDNRADCSARKSALDGSPPDHRKPALQVQDDADRQADAAEETLTKLRQLIDLIRQEAGLNLRIESRRLMTDVQAALNSKRPEIATFTSAITALKASIDSSAAAAAKAQSGQAKGAPKPERTLRVLVLPAGLKPEVVARFRIAEEQLGQKLHRATLMLNAHEAKRKRVVDLSASLECPAPRTPLLATGPSAPGGALSGSETKLEDKK